PEGLAAGDRARRVVGRGRPAGGAASRARHAHIVSAAGVPDDFERCRPGLRALARRMLGDPQRADDVVIEAWLRWQLGGNGGAGPPAGLAAVVSDLCRGGRGGAAAPPQASCGATALDRVSMALVAVVSRLSPPERAVFLLHDLFRLGHADVAALLG